MLFLPCVLFLPCALGVISLHPQIANKRQTPYWGLREVQCFFPRSHSQNKAEQIFVHKHPLSPKSASGGRKVSWRGGKIKKGALNLYPRDQETIREVKRRSWLKTFKWGLWLVFSTCFYLHCLVLIFHESILLTGCVSSFSEVMWMPSWGIGTETEVLESLLQQTFLFPWWFVVIV